MKRETPNQIPYMYDSLWLKYEQHYQTFHGLEFVKDLSIDTPLFYCPILLFRKDNKFYFRGYNNGIAGPYFKLNNSKEGINRLHLKARTNKINEAYHTIWNKIKDALSDFENPSGADASRSDFENPSGADASRSDFENLTIIQYPGYSYHCQHLLRPTNQDDPVSFFVKYRNGLAYVHQVSTNLENPTGAKTEESDRLLSSSIKAELSATIRNRLHQYDCGKTYDRRLIEVIDHHTDRKRICETFCAYRQKHTELSGRETKPDICWNILEQLIYTGKAILVHYSQSEFVYFLYSTKFSYYASNACTRGAEICTILIYEAMKWVITHGCYFIYYGEMSDESETPKLIQISRYKEKFSNKIFQGYSLETMRWAPHPSTAT